jgi:hypothetical protein
MGWLKHQHLFHWDCGRLARFNLVYLHHGLILSYYSLPRPLVALRARGGRDARGPGKRDVRDIKLACLKKGSGVLVCCC